MSNNVTFATGVGATVPSATVVETVDQGGGVHRQVVSAVLDQTTPANSRVNHATTGIGQGFKTSTSVGTGVVLAATTAAKWVTLQAYRSNTGFVAIGGSAAVNASATAGTGNGVNIAAGDSVTLPIDDLADVFIDVTISGEGVRYTYGT